MSSTTHIKDAGGREYRKVPVIDYENLKLPVLEMNREAVKAMDPNRTNPLALIVALLDQIGTQNNVLWAGMHALAKDIYSQDPIRHQDIETLRHFQRFAKEVGLVLTDHDGNRLDVGSDLEKV